MSDETNETPQSAGEQDFLARILDKLVDLAQTARDWVRQEAEAVVKDKIVPPLQKLGIAIASAFAAATLLVVGLLFIAVAAIVYLSQVLGVPLAFLLIGLVFVLGAAIFTSQKLKAMQR
jgi:hypothetical protein